MELLAGQSAMILLHCVILIGHSLVIMAITKSGLKDNRHFLIKTLSATDSLCSVVILTSLVSIIRSKEIFNNHMVIYTSFLAHLFHLLSLNITILITFDRYVAIKYSLRYFAIVTKKKLFHFIALMLVFNGAVLAVLFKYTNRKDFNYVSTQGAQIYLFVVRVLTCISILLVGTNILNMRKTQELRLKRMQSIYGKNAEKLTRLKTAKGSLKDVLVLNYLTAVFLAPLLVATIMTLLSIGSAKRIGAVNTMLISFHYFSNPVVYTLTQSRIRRWLKRQICCAATSSTSELRDPSDREIPTSSEQRSF